MIHNADAIILCDLGFGDSGKGTITDFLTRSLGAQKIVRHGGRQAAHNVVTSEGLHHSFSQFGSGTFVDGVQTFLSSNMLIAPDAFLTELSVLEKKDVTDALSRTYIDAESVLVTPWHTMVGQLLELERGTKRHGSCGMGVGQAIYDKEAGLYVTIGDLFDETVRRSKLELVFKAKLKIAMEILGRTNSHEAMSIVNYFMTERTLQKVSIGYENFAKRIAEQITDLRTFCEKGTGPIIFEGSQGALLDRHYGFFPHITKSVVTHHNATSMFNKIGGGKVHKLGIFRAYGHRHGAGPFPTEDLYLNKRIVDKNNNENEWQGKFRIGWLDLPLLRYAVLANDGIDSVAISCIDQICCLDVVKVCTSYDYYGNHPDLEKFFEVTNKTGELRQITDIKKTTKGREMAGKILSECSPNYITVPTHELVNFVESRDGLGIPVSIVSYGPRSDQKLFR